jgi:hypothetical protein
MADLPDNVGDEAPPDEEQVPVLHQIGKMYGVDFLLHDTSFTINLERANLMEAGLVDFDHCKFVVDKDIWDIVCKQSSFLYRHFPYLCFFLLAYFSFSYVL